MCAVAWPSFAQGLSSEVFPSEDELLQALENHEIEYGQYVVLREIAQHGLDSTNAYLLDFIPNLAFLRSDSAGLQSRLESEQRAGFEKKSSPRPGRKGAVKYGYYQSLDDGTKSRYRLSGAVNLTEKWKADFRINREYTGNERVVSRSVSYRGRNKGVRRLTLGSFVARFGLGTVIGYPGRLLDYSERLGTETLLNPDYGGFNGVYANLRSGSLDIESLCSMSRDTSHSLLVWGGMVARRSGRFRPGVLWGISRVGNRLTGRSTFDLKTGANVTLKYAEGYNSSEIAFQTGAGRLAVAAVTEGRHRYGLAEIKYAGWGYGDQFRGLISGSKAGTISRAVEIEEVGFRFTDRRQGQEGMFVRTTVPIGSDWELSNSLIMATLNADTTNVEFLSSVDRLFGPSLAVGLVYLLRDKKRISVTGDRSGRDQRLRLDMSFKSGNLDAKGYIAYSPDRSEGDFFSLFGFLRWQGSAVGKLEIWSNLGRIRGDVLEYWYLYVRNERVLFEGTTFAVKIANTYRGSGYDKNDTTLSLELKALL